MSGFSPSRKTTHALPAEGLDGQSAFCIAPSKRERASAAFRRSEATPNDNRIVPDIFEECHKELAEIERLAISNAHIKNGIIMRALFVSFCFGAALTISFFRVMA